MNYLIANWKMNPTTLEEAVALFHSSCDACQAVSLNNKSIVTTIILPPFIFIEELSKIPSDADLGAQNSHWEDEGAYTGEISLSMLKELKIKYVLVGHSERRWKMDEDDEMINKKIKAILRNGMTPILAVGNREKDDNVEQVLIDQISRDLKDLTSEEIKKIIYAYEPVWAISNVSGGETVTPENAQDASVIIKGILSKLAGIKIDAPILYGGSVNSSNVMDFINQDDIKGVLVGGASLDMEEIKKIIELMNE